MAGVHKQPDDGKSVDLDRTLDAALEKYAAVEPRTGLEDRILANLRAAQRETPVRSWWRWQAVAALAALVIIVTAVALRSGRPSHPEIAKHPSATVAPLREPVMTASNGADNPIHLQERRMVPRVVPPRTTPAAMAAFPRRDHFPSPQPLNAQDQFPSPRPLSEQERILAGYVSQFPTQAALIARAQTELRERDEREVLEKYGAAPAGIEPQNRQLFDVPNL